MMNDPNNYSASMYIIHTIVLDVFQVYLNKYINAVLVKISTITTDDHRAITHHRNVSKSHFIYGVDIDSAE